MRCGDKVSVPLSIGFRHEVARGSVSAGIRPYSMIVRPGRERTPDSDPVARLLSLATELVSARISFCVIGGLALHVRAPSHVPSDLDIVIAPGTVSALRARRGLQRVMRTYRDPYVPPIITASAREIARGREMRLQTVFGQLDVVGESLPGPYQQMARRLMSNREWVRLGGHSIPVCSAGDLVVIKLGTGRMRDAAHVRALRGAAAGKPGPGTPST